MAGKLYGIGADEVSTHKFIAYNPINLVWNGATYVPWVKADFVSYGIDATVRDGTSEYIGDEPLGATRYGLWYWTGDPDTSYQTYSGELSDPYEPLQGTPIPDLRYLYEYIKLGNVLTDPDGNLVTFKNIRRQDTSAIIMADTAATRISAGAYMLPIAENGAVILYDISYSVGGNPVLLPNASFPPAVVVSPFHSYQDFITRWGSKNVILASNKESSNTVDMAAVGMSFAAARDEIYDRFRNTIYKVPFDWLPNGGVVPATISRAAMVLAYEDLYTMRGLRDAKDDPTGNKITRLAIKARQHLSLFAGGLRSLPAATKDGSTQGAHVIKNTDVNGGWQPDLVPTLIFRTYP